MNSVTYLLSQIEYSYKAAQRATTSPSIMAPQQYVEKRLDEIEIWCRKIAEIIGDEFRAVDIVVARLAKLERL